ncbi:MAG: GNAT family N-acetyltransferase [Methylococcales bacterium]|nr:GNAT family N-acetyltransferase [Methylococcales bacterium]MBT7408408.1 GNAT family N-acetyltransferase [Methylococcales bacterium]
MLKSVKALDILEIRQKLLRPTGTLENCIFPEDNDISTIHFASYLQQNITSIVSLINSPFPHKPSSNDWQIRAMATLPEYRKMGYATSLLEQCILHSTSKQSNTLWCNARRHAVSFYQKFGFVMIGEEFNISDVGPHFLMKFSPKDKS